MHESPGTQQSAPALGAHTRSILQAAGTPKSIVDQLHAKSLGLKGTILHGSLTAAIMSTVVGRNLATGGWTVLEQNTRYRAVVYAGDTLKTTWTVSKHTDKSALSGWVVESDGVCLNQDDVKVAEGRLPLLVRRQG